MVPDDPDPVPSRSASTGPLILGTHSAGPPSWPSRWRLTLLSSMLLWAARACLGSGARGGARRGSSSCWPGAGHGVPPTPVVPGRRRCVLCADPIGPAADQSRSARRRHPGTGWALGAAPWQHQSRVGRALSHSPRHRAHGRARRLDRGAGRLPEAFSLLPAPLRDLGRVLAVLAPVAAGVEPGVDHVLAQGRRRGRGREPGRGRR